MFTSGIPSAWQSRFSIWPRFDAAAVCTRPLCPSLLAVYSIPRAVSGLQKADAASSGLIPAGKTRQSAALAFRSCPYIPPTKIDTVFPSSAWASGDAPALVTTPAPSRPRAIDLPIRATSARIAAGAVGAVTTVWLPFPDTFAKLTLPPASKSPRSEGLIGVASTRTITSSSFGGAQAEIPSQLGRSAGRAGASGGLGSQNHLSL